MSMKKDGIQTRKRKPKNHATMGSSLGGPSGVHKTEVKSSLLGESSVSTSIQELFSLKSEIRSESYPCEEYSFSMSDDLKLLDFILY